MRAESQKSKICKHLESGKPITPLEALNLYGCFRLAAIVFVLKEDGMDIKTRIHHIGEKHWASYILRREPEQSKMEF